MHASSAAAAMLALQYRVIDTDVSNALKHVQNFSHLPLPDIAGIAPPNVSHLLCRLCFPSVEPQ